MVELFNTARCIALRLMVVLRASSEVIAGVNNFLKKVITPGDWLSCTRVSAVQTALTVVLYVPSEHM